MKLAAILLTLAGLEPNLKFSWQLPPNTARIWHLESSDDLLTWANVVTVTNPFPAAPCAVGVGCYSPQHFFRLRLTP